MIHNILLSLCRIKPLWAVVWSAQVQDKPLDFPSTLAELVEPLAVPGFPCCSLQGCWFLFQHQEFPTSCITPKGHGPILLLFQHQMTLVLLINQFLLSSCEGLFYFLTCSGNLTGLHIILFTLPPHLTGNLS